MGHNHYLGCFFLAHYLVLDFFGPYNFFMIAAHTVFFSPHNSAHIFFQHTQFSPYNFFQPIQKSDSNQPTAYGNMIAYHNQSTSVKLTIKYHYIHHPIQHTSRPSLKVSNFRLLLELAKFTTHSIYNLNHR